MSQTCQRMRQIGGHYFRENFHGTVCSLDALGLNFCANRIRVDVERNDFLRFVDSVEICNEMKDLCNASSAGALSLLTTLRLFAVSLNEHNLHDFENVLANIETIDLNDCHIEDDSVGKFLASCPKLKCLRFDGLNFDSTAAKSSSFECTFPMLEYFQCTFSRDTALEIPSFLERNASIKHLRIGDDDLCEFPLDMSTIQLDGLIVQICSVEDHSVEFANRLKTLHSNGWYKTLHVSMWIDRTAFINEMASFTALEALSTFHFDTNIRHLTGLKELRLWSLPPDIDLEPIAMNLINLERLWISGSVDHLLPFLRHSKKLKLIVLDDRTFSGEAMNLFTMNKVRQLGGMKRKVHIGVFERQYLATKWTANNMNYDFVEITRAETIAEHFYYKDYHFDS